MQVRASIEEEELLWQRAKLHFVRSAQVSFFFCDFFFSSFFLPIETISYEFENFLNNY